MPAANDPIVQLKLENERLRTELASLKQSISLPGRDLEDSPDIFLREKMHAILEAIPIAVSWANADGVIEFTNRAFTELFGYDVQTIPTINDWFEKAYPDPDYNASVTSVWKEAVERVAHQGGDIPNMEVDVTCLDGSVKHVAVRSVLIAGCVLSIFDDLTDTNMARKALKESEQRFKAVFSGAKDGMLVADIETRKFYLANESIQSMLGYTEEELLSLQVMDIHPPESWDAVADHFERQSRKEDPLAPNLPVRKKNGDIFYADISSGPVIMDGRPCLIGIFRDISERKEYEEAILQERDFSEAALNSLPGIFYMFDQNGRFLRWNRNFEKVSAYSSEEINKISPLDLFQGEDRLLVQERIQEAFEKGQAEIEANLVSKNGTITPYYLTGLLSHFEGKPHIIGMGMDISRRKQAEKMNALGQLAGGIAHDFNNQLSAILGFAEILSFSLEDEKLKHNAKMIAQAATRSSDLIRQLLAFARKGKYQSELVDIHIIIGEVVALLRHSIDKRIVIKQNLAAPNTRTLCDSNQIQNALLNLAINARDAMPDGGELVFSTSQEILKESDCRDMGFDITPGPYLNISVSDTGKGIDADIQHHIFEPFFTTKEVGKGTGMGLAAVYGTINNHKGAITLSSTSGQGATFSIHLPLTGSPVHMEKADKPAAGTAQKKALILVVDDEELVRVVIADILKALGHEVILCKDGNEAVRIFEQNWERIDLVILDLMMPQVTGGETFVALRRINPQANILLASGFSVDGQAQALLDAGAMDFLQKPFTVSKLSEKIVKALQ